MIRQQINLYVRRESERVPFSASICALITLITVVLVGGLYGYEYSKLERLRAEVAAMKADKQTQDAEIAQLRQQIEARKADPALIGQKERLQSDLAGRRLYARTLAALEPGQQLPFSVLLQGLSKQAVQGLWLTRIAASNGGRALQLQGETLNPELIPQYLRRLGTEAAYRNARFNGFRVTQQDDRLRFDIDGVLQPGYRS